VSGGFVGDTDNGARVGLSEGASVAGASEAGANVVGLAVMGSILVELKSVNGTGTIPFNGLPLPPTFGNAALAFFNSDIVTPKMVHMTTMTMTPRLIFITSRRR